MKKGFSVLPGLLLLICGATGLAQKRMDTAPGLRSLVEAERAFSRTSVAKGIRDSFLLYLADDGILFRPHPVNGKKWMGEQPSRPGVLTWQPIYADISRAGDLGYTTGPWEFRQRGADDKLVGQGNYITIW